MYYQKPPRQKECRNSSVSIDAVRHTKADGKGLGTEFAFAPRGKKHTASYTATSRLSTSYARITPPLLVGLADRGSQLVTG